MNLFVHKSLPLTLSCFLCCHVILRLVAITRTASAVSYQSVSKRIPLQVSVFVQHDEREVFRFSFGRRPRKTIFSLIAAHTATPVANLTQINTITFQYNIQQYATLHSSFISGNCSTCFGWYLRPSSGAHTTVSTASDIYQTVTPPCRYRGR